MRRAAWLFVAALVLTCLPCTPALAWFGSPTAIIVDDETGEPIEGVIALAQWVKYKPTFLEGGIPYAARAKEITSDKNGKIYISGYWTWNPFACDRHLTVYKPGYALWNSEKKYYRIKNPPSKGFNRFTKVVRLVKFKKAAEEWKKIAYSESDKKYPRHLNYDFLGNCIEPGLDTNVITLQKKFRQYEMPFVRYEEAQKRREYEKSKKK